MSTDDAARALAKADMLMAAGRPQLALTELELLLGADPDSPAILVRIARAHLALEHPAAAVTAARAAVAADPEDSYALRILGHALAGAERYGDAKDAFFRAAELSPDEWQNYYLLAWTDQATGYITEHTRINAETARRLAPDEPDVHVQVGHLLFDRKRVAEARASFERALALDPHHENAQVALSGLMRATGDTKGATSGLLSVLSLNPQSREAHGSITAAVRIGVLALGALAFVATVPSAVLLARGRQEWLVLLAVPLYLGALWLISRRFALLTGAFSHRGLMRMLTRAQRRHVVVTAILLAVVPVSWLATWALGITGADAIGVCATAAGAAVVCASGVLLWETPDT